MKSVIILAFICVAAVRVNSQGAYGGGGGQHGVGGIPNFGYGGHNFQGGEYGNPMGEIGLQQLGYANPQLPNIPFGGPRLPQGFGQQGFAFGNPEEQFGNAPNFEGQDNLGQNKFNQQPFGMIGQDFEGGFHESNDESSTKQNKNNSTSRP